MIHLTSNILKRLVPAHAQGNSLPGKIIVGRVELVAHEAREPMTNLCAWDRPLAMPSIREGIVGLCGPP